MAARRSDRAAQAPPDRARRMVRGAARGDGPRARRAGQGGAPRRPRRTASSATACTIRSTRCSRTCSRSCPGTSRSRPSRRSAKGRSSGRRSDATDDEPVTPRRRARARDEHDRGDQRRARHHARARSRRRASWARTSAISAACSAPPPGLQKKHGKTRVFDTPISECGIIGAAVGMGAYGLRPVPEIQFADYIYPGLDQLVSEAARLRYRSAGEFIAPMTVRTPVRRRHLRRADPQPEPRGAVHPRRRAQDRGPVARRTTPRAC